MSNLLTSVSITYDVDASQINTFANNLADDLKQVPPETMYPYIFVQGIRSEELTVFSESVVDVSQLASGEFSFVTEAPTLATFKVYVFLVPTFDYPGIIFFTDLARGNLVYNLTEGVLYKSTYDFTAASPVDGFEVLSEPTLNDFLAVEDNTIYPGHTLLQYLYEYDLLAKHLIENKLANIFLEIDSDCHNECTMSNYENLRKKDEAIRSYFNRDNFVLAQRLYQETYDSLESNSCC
jgi:hypothetical protein